MRQKKLRTTGLASRSKYQKTLILA